MREGKKFYIQGTPYIVFIEGNKAHTRKLRESNEEAKTGKVRFENEVVNIKWHY